LDKENIHGHEIVPVKIFNQGQAWIVGESKHTMWISCIYWSSGRWWQLDSEQQPIYTGRK